MNLIFDSDIDKFDAEIVLDIVTTFYIRYAFEHVDVVGVQGERTK